MMAKAKAGIIVVALLAAARESAFIARRANFSSGRVG